MINEDALFFFFVFFFSVFYQAIWFEEEDNAAFIYQPIPTSFQRS